MPVASKLSFRIEAAISRPSAASRPPAVRFQVERLVASTKFVVAGPDTEGRGEPEFTG